MFIDLIIYFVILAALCAATPVCLVILYGVLHLFPKTRRMIAESADSNPSAA